MTERSDIQRRSPNTPLIHKMDQYRKVGFVGSEGLLPKSRVNQKLSLNWR